MQRESAIREPLILGHKTYKDITDDVVGPISYPAPLGWKILITISSIIAPYGVGETLPLGNWYRCMGIEQDCRLGLGYHKLRLVGWYRSRIRSTYLCVLLLFRQKWRMAINRSAEAMTIFAVIMAAVFPGIHMGRIWLAYWVFPLPNHLDHFG